MAHLDRLATTAPIPAASSNIGLRTACPEPDQDIRAVNEQTQMVQHARLWKESPICNRCRQCTNTAVPILGGGIVFMCLTLEPAQPGDPGHRLRVVDPDAAAP